MDGDPNGLRNGVWAFAYANSQQFDHQVIHDIAHICSVISAMEIFMIDTIKFGTFITPSMRTRLRDKKALKALGVVVAGHNSYVPQPHSSDKLKVRRDPKSKLLWTELSPAYFFQRHNVFGSNRAQNLCLAAVQRLYEALGMQFDAEERKAVVEHRFQLRRLDLACSIRLNSQDEVTETLQLIHEQLHASGEEWTAFGTDDIESVYRGMRSTRVTDKFYNKLREIEARRRIPIDLPERDRILDFARGLLRYEVVFRGKELRRLGLDFADCWTPDLVRQTILNRLKLLNPQGAITQVILPGELQRMSRCSRTFGRIWAEGGDLRRHRQYPPVKRARSDLLRHGVDILRPKTAFNRIGLRDIFAPDNIYFFAPKALVNRGAIFGVKKTGQNRQPPKHPDASGAEGGGREVA